jgi:hypothetical protein
MRTSYLVFLLLTAFSVLQSHALPPCATTFIAEDFEACPAGTWIGNCNDWQPWANGWNSDFFFITDQEHVSGSNALQVSGNGSCYEGGAYKHLPPSSHIFLQAMIKASGDGPNGCHHRQNGIEINAAGWTFEMGGGEGPEGLNCFAAGAGFFTVVEGFQNAAGRWYAVAVELDYDTGLANFWLDGQPVWTTPFDTGVQAERVWMRSGEGRGWFDDIMLCEIQGPTAVPPLSTGSLTCSRIKNLFR